MCSEERTGWNILARNEATDFQSLGGISTAQERRPKRQFGQVGEEGWKIGKILQLGELRTSGHFSWGMYFILKYLSLLASPFSSVSDITIKIGIAL